MNNINNNKISKFGFLYKSIFIGLETEHYDSATNAFFWIFLTIKIVFQWIFAIKEYKTNKLLFILLFIPPFAKFILISLGALERFKKLFYKNYVLIIFITILLIIECFYELPIHCLFPVNRIYMHTNYYRIFDLKERIDTYLGIEIIESFGLFLYIINCFINGKVNYSSVILFIFLIIFLTFYIYAEAYYRCVDILYIQSKIDEKQRQKRQNPIEYNKKKGYITEESSLNSKEKERDVSVKIPNN